MTTNWMNKKLAVLTIAAAALSFQARAYAAEQWDLLTYLPLTNPLMQNMVAFAKEVKTATNGDVVVTVRVAGELPYGVGDYHRAVGTGEVAMADTAFFMADAPAAGALTLPGLVRSFDEMKKAESAVRPEIEAQLAKFGAKPLMWTTYAPLLLWGKNEPMKSLADMKGKAIRGHTAEIGKVLKAIGAVPVTLATPEVMPAVQTGTVDALLTAHDGVVINSWQEVLNWGLNLRFSMVPSYLFVNQEKLEGLSPQNQEAIRKLAAKYQQSWWNLAIESEGKSAEIIREQDITVYEPSDADMMKLGELASPVWEDWANTKGPEAEQILKKIRSVVGR